MMANEQKIRGSMRLTVRSAGGGILAERRANNMVVRGGAGIIARLFTGAAGAVPINQVQVGFATDSGTAELKALTPPPTNIPLAALRSPIKQADFQVIID